METPVQLICILLAFIGTAASHTFTRNGQKYEVKSSKRTRDASLTECGGNLLWVKDKAEVEWLITKLSQIISLTSTKVCWTSAKGTDTHWPNGEPLISGLPAAPNSVCLALSLDKTYPNTMMWKSCVEPQCTICKNVSTDPVSACDRSSSQVFSLLAPNRRQNASDSELLSFSARSLMACATECLGNKMCCAFELRGESGRCLLLSAAAASKWVTENGTEIYGIGP